MTTPGGVPNLPQGALTLDTIASKTQDMTTSGMRGRTNERVSSIFGASTGGDITSDLSPLGIIASLFAGFSSVVANADPADITGPEDLPGLLLDFIESLPFVGQFVGLFEAILGDYTGDDTTLLAIQDLFEPIRAVVDVIMGAAGGLGGLTGFFDLGGSGSILGILDPIFNLFGGATTSTGAGNFMTDLLGIFGNPTGLGTGSTTLPGISSIPILGGLLSGGNILTSIIPGLDASKIISGAFSFSQITNLSTVLGGFGTGSSILTQLLGLIPNLASGTTGLTGLGDVFTDLFSLLGTPTNVGSSGTLTLPGISSIPVLGGLLSGGNILTSIIPGLDASKIITGSFGISQITNLATMLGGLGTGSSIINQILAAVPNLASGTTGLTGLGDVFTDLFGALGSPTNVGSSGTFTLPGISSIPLLGGLLSGGNLLASIIPGLDASKIITGVFSQSQVTGLTTLSSSVTTAFQNTYNSWFPSGGATGTPAEVATTIAAIRAAVAGGYTLQTFTASDPTWSVPSGLATATTAIAGVIGGGGRGAQGQGAVGGTLTGGLGGSSGGITTAHFDASTLGSTVAIVVGGGASTQGTNGGTSSFGSIVTSSPNGNGDANVATYSFSTSFPGKGGDGGGAVVSVSQDAGSPGGDTAQATGGAGGTASTGTTGGPGGAGSAGSAGVSATTPICGGGGGGGGGARRNTAFASTSVGGAGGAGGFPGGGSGGGGAGMAGSSGTGTGGAGGTAANGLVFVLWK